MATISELLADAEAAYHKVMTGTGVAQFRDQNGEMVLYTKANAPDLMAYIKSLGGPTWLNPDTTITGPLRVFM